jgi:hypothetical protein
VAVFQLRDGGLGIVGKRIERVLCQLYIVLFEKRGVDDEYQYRCERDRYGGNYLFLNFLNPF